MPLSKEKIEQIGKDADKFAFQVPYNGTNDFYDNDRFDAYIAGATAEAEKALCLIEALDEINAMTEYMRIANIIKEAIIQYEK